MKKMFALGVALVVLTAILAGCPNDPGGTPDLASMAFVNNVNNPGQEFTIDENLSFSVRFLEAFFYGMEQEELEALAMLGIVPGLVVSGRVMDTPDTWTSSPIEGTARDMTSNDENLNFLLDTIDVDIRLTYFTVGGEITSVLDEINSVLVEFTDGEFAEMAAILMGGSYTRIR